MGIVLANGHVETHGVSHRCLGLSLCSHTPQDVVKAERESET